MRLAIKRSSKQRRDKSRRRGARCWVLSVGVFGALVAYTVGESRAVTIARLRRGPAPQAQAQAQSEARRFDIQPGPLESVLEEFQRLTGWVVIVPNERMGGISSQGLSGVHTPEQGLKQLLTGTGVGFKLTAERTATLEIQTAPESVEIRENASPISSAKYTEPLRDIPQTITVIPSKIIQDQGATTLRDVLQNVPGLTLAAGEGGAPAGDNLTLRGFSARNDIFVDNVRDIGPQTRDPFNLEQVEVVKGPASAYSGRGSTGGTINLVSKSPVAGRFFGGTLSLGTDKTKRGTADINLPLSNRVGFRLNLMAHDSKVAGREVVANERWGFAPSLTFGLGTPTRLTLGYMRVSQDNLSDYGIPWVPATNNVLVAYRDRPAPVLRDTFYGFRNRDFERLSADLLTARFEHDFNDRLSLRNQFRYGRSTRDSVATPPRFNNNDSTVINREMRSWSTEDDIWDNQTDLRAGFSTGKVVHSLVTGLVLTREKNLRGFSTAPNTQTTLLNPNPDDVYTGTITVSPNVGDVTGDTVALYVFDTAKLHEKFELTGGLRFDRFAVGGVSATATAVTPIERVDQMLGWRAGAVYKPLPQGSIYASMGTSLNPSLEGLSYGIANTAIEPEKTRNFEVGTKWDLFRNRLLLSGAAFRVEKTNARTPGVLPDDPPQVLDGLQRVNGLELGVTGTPVRGWTLFAAYTLLDSRIVDSNTPAEVGKRFINTPKNSFSLWTTYLYRRFEMGGGARFVGLRYGNNTNTRFVESYRVADAMVAYRVTETVSLRLNVYNLTDTYYFDRLGGGHVVPGPGRSALLSTSFRF
ncbi:MAG: TonB-dependent siderophore receptor [Pyrinomonadaceae bacterium]